MPELPDAEVYRRRLSDVGLHRRIERVRVRDRQMLRVLDVADRGADPSRFPKGWLLWHREEAAPCPRGNGEIKKIRLGGRGAYWCPVCQPAPT